MLDRPPVRHYYAAHLLSSRNQIEAADHLLGVLLLRKQLEGHNLSYYAARWNVTYARVNGNVQRARGALYLRNAPGVHDTSDPQLHAYRLPLKAIQADYRKYAEMIGDFERDLVFDLDDERTEALIRQMFRDDCRAVFLRQRPKRQPRSVTHPRRGPGRPPGSKNKPKVAEATSDGWVMPDGFEMKG